MVRAKASSEPTSIDLVLLIQPSRSISDDHWEEIDVSHIEIWKKAASLFKSHEYESETISVRIEFDWTPVVRRLRRHLRVMDLIHNAAVEDKYQAYNDAKFPRRPVRVDCNVKVTGKKDKKKDAGHVALFYTEIFLYDLFLILNLAAPGCCTLWRAMVRQREKHRSWQDSNLLLSEFSYDLAYIEGLDGKWPSAKLLDLEKVLAWYRSVRSGTNQIPENRAQKVLFALMHMAKASLSIDTVVWLFYALETLYDTQPGENRRALTSRVGLVLSPDEKQRAYLKKEFRDLYDIRSGFAHGGREIAHPINNEQFDRRVEGAYSELMKASEFGFAVLLASLQRLIEAGAKEFSFQETLVPSA